MLWAPPASITFFPFLIKLERLRSVCEEWENELVSFELIIFSFLNLHLKSKAESPGMDSGFSRGWSFSYLCPFHTRHHCGSQGRLQASRPARVHSFLCPPKALHLVAMATCCQEQAASLHELQHPFVVHSIPSWSAASPPGSQHPFTGCSHICARAMELEMLDKAPH